MEVNNEIIPHGNGNQDFGDQLPPGYRFCPTDSELIVYYLSAKIESRKLPECRLHEVNIYNHKPEELAERYRCSENKWYFFSPRDRKYPKGNRPKRGVGKVSYWKATQRQREVSDGSTGAIVGHRTNLAFYEKKGKKTQWLMQEYTTDIPNIPCGSGNTNKLNEWVLCKIYKHETKESTSNDERGDTTNEEDAIDQERNGTGDRPSHKRRRESENNNHSGNDVNMVAPLSNNMFGFNQQPVGNFPTMQGLTTSMGSIHKSVNQGLGDNNGGQTRLMTTTSTSPNPIAVLPTVNLQASTSRQPINPCYQNQFTYNESNNGFQFPNCVSSSCVGPPDADAAQPLDYGGYMTATLNYLNPIQTTLSADECYDQNMYTFNGFNGVQSPNDVSSSFIELPKDIAQPLYSGGYTAAVALTPVTSDNILQQQVHDSYQDSPTLLIEQNGANQSMVVPQDDFDLCFLDELLPDDATIPALDEIDWTLEYIDSCLYGYENTNVGLVSD